MRFNALTTISGMLGLAALAAAAPAASYGDSDSCALSATTVFVTVPQAVTVTIHDTPTSYVTLDLSEPPTSTLTRTNTLYSTTTTLAPETDTIYLSVKASTSDNAAAITTPTPSYESTVFETTVVTVTNVQLTPASSGGSLTYGETPASNGLLTFVVENGTTYWLNGQTPPPSQSYVVETSVVTVVPVNTPITKQHHTSTLTLHTTIYSTTPLTIIETLSAVNSSSTRAYNFTASSFGTVPTTARSSWAGWNATSTAGGALSTGVSNQFTTLSDGAFNPYSQVSFVTEESTFDIYEKPTTTHSLSSYAAKSGFNVLTSESASQASQPSTPLTSAPVTGTSQLNSTTLTLGSATSAPQSSSTSSAVGEWTTAVVGGQTISWGGPAFSTMSSASSSLSTNTPYANSTTSAVAPSVTKSAVGADTTCTEEQTKTASSLTGGSTSSLPDSTGSALGIATSSSPSFSSSISATAASQPWSSTSVGNITSFWTSQPIATLPTSYTSPLSSSGTLTTLSGLSSTSSGASTQYSSILSGGTYSVTNPASTAPSTVASQTATSVSSTNSVLPSLCGEHGDFTLSFDDIPPLSVSNQSANAVNPEPVFSPYHQFDFSNGFDVVPPPTEQYNPSSPPLLVEFIPNFNLSTSNSQSGPNSAEFGWSGDIGNADHGVLGCFSFNVYGASFGCDSDGPDCVFSFTGFRYDPATHLTNPVVTDTHTIQACPTIAHCQLIPIALDSAFQDLDKIRINVTVAGEPKLWWMDDLRLGWTDNSCSQGLCRQGSHIHAVNHL
ncbi:hypothetical protein EG329_014394 [Mollisiaceae sp. DMI_Dod_QoI]|nr:hypothetical protein EG329_014394 [Helotiales sp. DMI_Dod_QoI]